MRRELQVFPDLAKLSAYAAVVFVEMGQQAVADHGRFAIALSGGSTPRRLYELLARPPFAGRVPWEQTHVFWSDERGVPPDHAMSNYRMAHDALLRHVPLPAAQVHRMPTELPDRDAAAAQSAQAVRAQVPVRGGWPGFDLILLGMGADGHTASLFPGSEALAEKQRALVPVSVPGREGWRLTLTLPVINAAAQVIILVTGAEKAETLRAVLAGSPAGADLPVALVCPTQGHLLWLVDWEAARLLEPAPALGATKEAA